MDTQLSADAILEIGQSFWKAKALMSAVELNLFTMLASDGPLDVEQIRARAGLHQRGARDFLDALVALALLDRDAQQRYSNTPASSMFLDRGKPTYQGGFLEMCNDRLYPAWTGLTAALRTGRSVHAADDQQRDFYERIYADAASRRTFLAGMTGSSRAIARALIERFPWRNYATVVDVGCAQGSLLMELASAHDHIRAVGFDLPAVAPLFDELRREAGLDDRVRFHAGNFRDDSFPAADVIIFGRVLHNWNLETKRHLLQQAKAALRRGGRVIVYERLIDDDRRTHATALLASLNMLVVTPEGFDFTGADCRAWMRDAGFTGIYVEPLAASHAMVVGTA